MTTEINEQLGAEVKQKYAIRYGALGFIGEFEYASDESLRPGVKVLIETDRGLELGRVVCRTSEPDEYLRIDPKQIKKFVENSGEDYLKPNAGRIVKPANEQDLREAHHIEIDALEKKKFCIEAAKRLGLNMKIVFVEHLFGGERIIFYFLAEGRIDFRELVRELAREYQTRIELRQIGARDEARLLADYEICGRECCCKNFLKTLRPVNMKMAKLQKATLDPSKVSGRCGRLRCCLQYEQKTYEELLKALPRIGTYVQTEAGVGKVRDYSAITQLVQVAFDDDRIVTFPVEELSPAQPPERSERQILQVNDEQKPINIIADNNTASKETDTAKENSGQTSVKRKRSSRRRRKRKNR